MRRNVQALCNTACRAIESKGRWNLVAATPGTIEARFRTQRSTWRYRTVIREVRNGDVPSALRVVAIPELRNRLPVSESELQAPTVDRGRSGIGDREVSPKAAGPLVADSIADLAARAGDGRRGWSGCRRIRRGWSGCIRRGRGWRRCGSAAQREQMRLVPGPIVCRCTRPVADERWRAATVPRIGPGPGQVTNVMRISPAHQSADKARCAVILTNFARYNGYLRGNRCDLRIPTTVVRARVKVVDMYRCGQIVLWIAGLVR